MPKIKKLIVEKQMSDECVKELEGQWIDTSHITYQQIHKGIPVFGRFITFHNNVNGELSSISNGCIPDIDFKDNNIFKNP